MKEFFGFEIFDFKTFWVRTLASSFWVGLSEVGSFFGGGIQNNMKIHGKELLPCAVAG